MHLLTTAIWQGQGVTSTQVRNPSWPQVEDAIRALDNRSRNDVYLQWEDRDPHTWLVVGGGAGRYIVSGTTLDERYPALLTSSPCSAEEFQMLTVGGQEGDYLSAHVVTLEEALSAAKGYFETGSFRHGQWREA